MRRPVTNIFAALALVTTFGCAGGEPADTELEPAAEAAPAESPTITVRIVEPAEGAEVGSTVRVVLEASGIEIAPISPPVDGTGHHHLFLDADVTPMGVVIPADDPRIIHKGDGSSEHTLEGLAPGPHRLIAVLADPAHIPIAPLVADTVSFTVVEGA